MPIWEFWVIIALTSNQMTDRGCRGFEPEHETLLQFLERAVKELRPYGEREMRYLEGCLGGWRTHPALFYLW
jgi:hypothetical protein